MSRLRAPALLLLLAVPLGRAQAAEPPHAPGPKSPAPSDAVRSGVAADDSEDAPGTLRSEVVVSGRPRRLRGLSQIEIGRAELDRYGQANVAESLERLASVQGAQDDRGERLLSLRGFTQRGVVAFVDGIPLSVPYDGQVDLSKVPIDAVERITIVQGSAPALYGPNGTGGSFNVVTRAPSLQPFVRARTELARFGTRSSGSFTGRFGAEKRVGVMLAIGHENRRYLPLADRFPETANEGGSRRDNSDLRALSGHAKLSYELTPRDRITLHAARFGGEFGVPPATHDFLLRNWRWSSWNASVIGLGHSHVRQGFSIESQLYGSFFGNTLDSYDDARLRTQRRPKAFQSIYDDHTLGLSVRTRAELAAGRLSVSTWSGVRRDHHTGIADRGAPKISADTNLMTTSVMLDAELWPKKVHASLGLQLDGELPDPPSQGPSSKPSFSPSPLAGVSYRHGDFSLGVNAAMRTRIPTLRERFSAVFGTRAPNPELGPERSLNASIDASYLRRWGSFDASLFHSTVRDLVTDTPIGPALTQMQNVSEARLMGADARARVQPAPWLDLHGSLMLLSAKRLDGDEPRLSYRPRFKSVLSAVLRPHPRLRVSALVRSVGAQDYQNPNHNGWERLDGYTLLDARAEWQLSGPLRLWLRADNLLGSYAQGRYSFPEAGRQVWLGAATELPL